MSEKYVIEYHPNERMATVHLSVLVPRFFYEDEEGGFTEEGRRFFEPLNQLPGVEEAQTCGRYGISIERGGVFSWSHVLAGVVSYLAKHFEVDFEPGETPVLGKEYATDADRN